MAREAQRGFTLIEVLLFFAITAALFAALMVGVGNSVTQQRYLDSVRSFKSLVQQQYSEVLNTRNELFNGTNYGECKPDKSGTVDEQVQRTTPRGTSGCVVLGRAIRLSNDGQTVTTSSITGHDPTGTLQDDDSDGKKDSSQINSAGDIAALTTYFHAKLATYDNDATDVDWSSQLKATTADGGGVAKAMILIVKSPATGSIKIFLAKDETCLTSVNDLTNCLTNTSATTEMKLCMDGNSGFVPEQVITINPAVSGPDAISTSDSNGECS